MKQILFILIGIAFLQTPISTCLCNTRTAYAQECTTAADEGRMFQEEKATDDEIKTANIFHSFIIDDVARRKEIKNGEKLYYTKYQKTDDAFAVILNFIYPADRRTEFDRDKKYDSALITVEWEENSTGKTVVKDGFAQLKVKFKAKKENYTVVFRR